MRLARAVGAGLECPRCRSPGLSAARPRPLLRLSAVARELRRRPAFWLSCLRASIRYSTVDETERQVLAERGVELRGCVVGRHCRTQYLDNNRRLTEGSRSWVARPT